MTVADEFVEISERVVWATMATVSTQGRPRSRVVHPLWSRESESGAPVGWVTTRRTPTKVAHLAATPYVSISYWSPDQDTAVAECAASWVDDPAALQRVWRLAADTAPPLGFDPAPMYAGGPLGGDFAVLELRPWLLQVRTLDDLMHGRRPRAWRRQVLAETA